MQVVASTLSGPGVAGGEFSLKKITMACSGQSVLQSTAILGDPFVRP
jgi:hypothetical protein